MSILYHELHFILSADFSCFCGDTAATKEIDLRDYAKYLLRNRSLIEKCELLICIKSKLVLEKGELQLH